MTNSVRDLRALKGWSPQELAGRLEVSRQTVNAVEIGKYNPSLPLAFKIATLFSKRIEQIFTLDKQSLGCATLLRMALHVLPHLTANHVDVDLADDKFGFLDSSTHLLNQSSHLRERMAAEGYLFMPGLLDRDEVLAARRECTTRLTAKGLLDAHHDIVDCVAEPDANTAFMPDLAKGNDALMHVLYAGAMMRFFEALVGGPALHFDFTWFRAVSPGKGTLPHMDVVYMGRGTKRLFTAWTPIGDIPLEQGGLMVLEHSHLHDRLNKGYGSKDVDTFCENRREPGFKKMGGGGNIQEGGVLSKNAVKLRDRLGGRWLTSDYRAGDVLIFSVYSVHASLDNHSKQIRLSSDSRYQSANEPADHRWVGPNPIGHGPEGKRGMVC